jgi:hypothetical protein
MQVRIYGLNFFREKKSILKKKKPLWPTHLTWFVKDGLFAVSLHVGAQSSIGLAHLSALQAAPILIRKKNKIRTEPIWYLLGSLEITTQRSLFKQNKNLLLTVKSYDMNKSASTIPVFCTLKSVLLNNTGTGTS